MSPAPRIGGGGGSRFVDVLDAIPARRLPAIQLA